MRESSRSEEELEEQETEEQEDALIKEFVDAIIGDYYPSQSRCLVNTEKILNEYLQSIIYNSVDLKDSTKVFPT